mgnify:CR=1 FL=1
MRLTSTIKRTQMENKTGGAVTLETNIMNGYSLIFVAQENGHTINS